jgi:hypothetical protein
MFNFILRISSTNTANNFLTFLITRQFPEFYLYFISCIKNKLKSITFMKTGDPNFKLHCIDCNSSTVLVELHQMLKLASFIYLMNN